MKWFFSLVATLSFQFSSAEIVTLSAESQSVTLEPSDVVQVVSVTLSNLPPAADTYLTFTKAAGGTPLQYNIPIQGFTAGLQDPTGAVLTGITRVAFSTTLADVQPVAADLPVAVTLRITKQAEQFFSEPVVLPAVTDQNYTVELQTSTDLTNWIPAVPGDYLGGATNRFFRVKVEAKPE